MTGLRVLAAAGALLVLAGAVLGWFDRTVAALVDGPVRVVRPDGVLSMGVGGWLVLVPLALAPFAPFSRRWVTAALVAAVPGLVFVALAGGLPQRRAVSGETIGEVVASRPLGQGLSLVGALFVVMAMATAWTRAPDWRQPHRWARETAQPAPGKVTEP